jgi:hypothetical protein
MKIIAQDVKFKQSVIKYAYKKSNNKETGLVVLWVKLRSAGYTRSVTSLYRMMIKLGIYEKILCKKKDIFNLQR